MYYGILFSFRYGSGSFSFGRLIRTMSSAFSTQLELEEVHTDKNYVEKRLNWFASEINCIETFSKG